MPQAARAQSQIRNNHAFRGVGSGMAMGDIPFLSPAEPCAIDKLPLSKKFFVSYFNHISKFCEDFFYNSGNNKTDFVSKVKYRPNFLKMCFGLKTDF